jgi:putative transposase
MSPMAKPDPTSHHESWARLRFAIVGPLLSSPPRRGELKPAIEALATRFWRHPVSSEDVRFAFSTIESWYYRAKKTHDPIGRLRRATRKDLGKRVAISQELEKEIVDQYRAHKDWSYKLHADNLAALVEERSALGRMPSYSTIRRFMKESGLLKLKAVGARPGQLRAQKRFESREVRSYEAWSARKSRSR